MEENKPLVFRKYDNPQDILDVMRVLVGAIEAVLIERHYDFATHSFVESTPENLQKDNTFVTGPGTIIKGLRENEKGKYEKFAVWYRVILPLSRRPLIPILQRFMGDPTKEPIKVGDQSYPGTDFKFPAFFMCAIWVVLVHLNWTEGENPFRDAYLTKTGNPSETRFAYRFADNFQVPNAKFKPPFDIVTSDVARQEHNVEGFLAAKKEVEADPKVKKAVEGMDKDKKALYIKREINRLLSERRVWSYLDLNPRTKRDSELFKISSYYFILTNNPSENDDFREIAQKYLKPYYKALDSPEQISRPLEGDNSTLIPKAEGAKPQSSQKPAPPKSETKPKSTQKPKVDVEVPPTATPAKSRKLSDEEEEEERLKRIWANDIESAVIQKLADYINKGTNKAKILASLNVAAGLSSQKTKTGGDVFNLNTTRLVKKDNQNTGVVIGSVPGEPIFKGRRVDLAMNVKDPVMKWFSSSKIGTPLNLTANNKALAGWVKDELMPRIWKRFASIISQDVEAMNVMDFEDNDDVDERVEQVDSQKGEEEEEPSKPTFKKTFNLESQLDFIPSFAASLPIMPEDIDPNTLGGDLSKLRAQVFNVDKAAMGLDKGQVEHLKVVRKNLAAFFTPDTQPVIAQVRASLEADVKEKVGPNGAPFEMEEPDMGRIDQFSVDYRLRATVTTEEPQFEDEEGEETDV